ncbi:MAG TPA: hypothetical protein VKE51_21695 [Vicinamibacterales bacterium]|nr:hypothetical protein [Vicinamibacterales bacterium]
MQWSLSQTGSSVTGQASASTASGAVTFTAAVTGTISGSDLTWTMEIRAGGISALPDCSATIKGSASIAANAMTGSYSGTTTCNEAFTDGHISLTKQ